MNLNEAILRDADQIITDRGWCQQRAIDPVTNAVCLSQAIVMAAETRLGATAGSAFALSAERVLLRIVAERGVRPRGFYAQIFMWNDEKTTTVEDVHLLLKEGIEAQPH